MTPGEFKAWFEGFTEAFEGRVPTKAQWKRVQERVAEIDGKPVTERIYLDRYWPYNYPYSTTWLVGSSPTRIGAATCGTTQFTSVDTVTMNGSWDGATAMYALGKADAVSVT